MSEPTYKPPELESVYSDDPAVLKRRQNNSKLLVNQLPPEILSYIMLIGTDSDRGVWRWESRKIASQHIASVGFPKFCQPVPYLPSAICGWDVQQVCGHWRDVAINDPKLWTFVHISSTLPNKYSALCIARSGICALDVLIDLCQLNLFPLPFDNGGPRVDTGPVFNILHFLTSSGAGASRWRSLFLRSPNSGLLPVFITFLGNNSPSALQLLRLECDGSYHKSSPPGAASLAESSRDIGQGSSFPELHELELVSVPWPFSIKMTGPLPILRTLSITSGTPYSTEFANVLMFNPQLETIYLKGDSHYGECDPRKLNLIQPVVLSSLRSLYIHAEIDVPWALRMLMTIKAPGLYHLAVIYHDPFASSQERRRLVSYLASGGDSLDRPGSPDSASQPAYPSIQSLDISQFPCKKNEFTTLVTSFPLLTHLTIRRKQAEWLSEAPRTLPRLGSLASPQWSAEAVLKYILRLRAEAGTPIKLARFRKGYMKLVALQDVSSAMKDRPRTIPQYEYYGYDEDIGARGDWQSMRQQPGTVNNGLDVRIECDDYDSEEYDSEEYDSEDYRLDDYDDRLHTIDYDG